MTYQPPANASLWQVFLADEEGFVTTVEKALDEYGPESHVEVSIRRLSALPHLQAADNLWSLPGRPKHEADIAVEWKLDLVDDIGETDHITAQLNAAHAMAAGLNGALANQGEWNRSTELAAALHNLGDKLATFDGALPSGLYFHVLYGHAGTAEASATLIQNVDALGAHLLGKVGERKSDSTGYDDYKARGFIGPLTITAYGYVVRPAEEDPRILLARIAELQAEVAAARGGAA
ncbi:hypothetical protein AMIS_2750 [Actinoplanes missouriensis 431]|uniref:Uncharacterized protein n=1 Tax=Actinoplanes missouriensis (strain ATCC 14538 / DSM 43046 / CBS 188.64 / JCM 3121 / NBRC 102363 / NCIMB 12654 / NRRL B-3342 / UNCC 431) TaxID=512565 RepID=I0GXK8_ACTM4|nr:hypothetical protein [Actinoplanes missouriensis]BAL85495.1 hypothetical protein AMIS_2750 [Actinoplanes missouriensis 431]